MIPIVDLKGQHQGIKKEILRALEGVLDSCQFILGDELKKFEEEVARFAGKQYAVGVANGTDAIVLALKAYGIQAGDAVVTSAFTYYATAGAIARCGATPVFCDIDPKTYNISPEKLGDILREQRTENREQNRSRQAATIKAVVPVDLYGQIADMDEINTIAKRYGLKVIEDAAQAFGGQYKAKRAGSLGDAGCFSFFPGKNLGACGDAGMVVTDDKAVAELLQIYRNQGNKIKYEHMVIGHNSRLDTVQAAILRVKLRYIDQWNRNRRSLAEYYDEKLKALGIAIPFVGSDTVPVYHLYVIRFKDRQQKDGVHKALSDGGVDARTYYPIPLHLQECFRYLGYSKGDFPESERASEETLAIPMYAELTREQQDFIIGVVEKSLE